MTEFDVEERARLYAYQQNRAIEVLLGEGTDGSVWKTNRKTAIKVFIRHTAYQTERDRYRIFRDRNITEICGFAIPRLIDFNDELMVVEMDIVQPPSILDFGKVYLKRPPPHFTREVMAEWHDQQRETWGDHWPVVQRILTRL
jgi:hypothetical protein